MVEPNASVARHVHLENPHNSPRIVLAIGPCRSGSTPLVMLLAAAGVESHMQPLKIILRCLSVGRECSWRLPGRPPDVLFLKETLGPYLAAEVEFNPLEILLRAGVPAQSITPLIVAREPLSTWASWSEWWGERTNLDLFEESMRATERIYQQALNLGLEPATFVYEALREVEATRVSQRLFDALRIPFRPSAVSGWQSKLALGEPESPIHWLPMPSAFAVPHIHDRVRTTSGLTYFDRENDVAALPAAEVSRIRSSSLLDLYATWRERCARGLCLELGPQPTAERE